MREGHKASVHCRAQDVAPGADRLRGREANVFAAELLMPEEAVRAHFEAVIADCARMFGVSEEAMHWRLYNLGLAERPRPE